MVRTWWVVLVMGGLSLASDEDHTSSAGLSLVKKCGLNTCTPYQYCSDLSCHDCSFVCDKSHNYDASVCENRCQDYIHDRIKHYLTEADSLKATQDLQKTIEGLWRMVAASMAVSCIVGLGLLALIGYLVLKSRRTAARSNIDKDMLQKKVSTVSEMFNNNKDKPLRLEMPSTGAPSVVTTTTPVSTRHPCEDTTLEYAYDNPNLTPSPHLPTPRHETTF